MRRLSDLKLMNAPHDVDSIITHRSRTTLLVLPDKDTDHVQRYVHKNKTFYELELLEHAAARLAPDSLVLDVGAYIGTHTLFLANVCGLRVHAFEPNPQSRAVLQRNVKLNDLDHRVTVSALALGAESAAGRVIPGNPGNLGQAKVELGAGDVTVVRLDDLAFSSPVAAIKVDVEGSELAVLRGAQRLLREQRPLLYVECATLDALADVIDFLAAQGYAAGPHFNATPTIAFHPGPVSLADVNAQVALHQHVTQRRFERLHGDLGAVTRRLQHSAQVDEQELQLLGRLESSELALEARVREQQELQLAVSERVLAELRSLRLEQTERAASLNATFAVVDARTRALQAQLEHTVERMNEAVRLTQQASLSLTMRRKLQKLARNPDKFFADASHPLLRVGARRVYRELSPPLKEALSAPPLRKLKKLYGKPHAFLRDAKSPLLQSLGRSLSPWLEAHGGHSLEPAPRSQAARKPKRTAAPNLRVTETSVVVVMPAPDESSIAALRALVERLGAADELIVVAPQSGSALDLERWAGALSAERARLYLHHGAFELGGLIDYGLEHAHGQRCLLLVATTPAVVALSEPLLRQPNQLAELVTFADGSVAIAAASRAVLRAESSPNGTSLTVERALRGAAERGVVKLSERALLSPGPESQPHAGEGGELYFCAPSREPQLAEDLLAKRPGRAHVFVPNLDALHAAFPEEGLGFDLVLLDLRRVPEFLAYGMPADDGAATSVLCLERRPPWARAKNPGHPSHGERVSVIMTARDAEATIDLAIASVLGQTHANVELIFVDDCSTDGTLRRAQWYARFDRRVRVFRAPRPMGDTWCKRFGLTFARGKHLMFQEADEIALAPRVELLLALLHATPGRMAASVGHLRRCADENPLAGASEDDGLRGGLMVRRALLREMGYFDRVRVSDDAQLPSALAAAARAAVHLPLTYGFAYQVAKREPEVQRVLVLEPAQTVTASMATMPTRVPVLERTVASLLPQVDRLNVYLNNFEQVPEFLRHPKIQIARSQEHGDLKDNGKFFFTRSLLAGYHLTVDDDIQYPPDYVQASVLAIERYERRAVVGVHGVNLDPELKRYIKGRQVFHFGRVQEHDRFVQLLGTGTVAYHTSTLRLELADFRTTGVADLWFATVAKQQGVPLVSQRRRDKWLVPLEHGGETIFAEVSRDDSRETELARMLGPWNEQAFAPVHGGLVQALRAHADYGQLEASGYDLHTIVKLEGKPPIHIVLVVPGWNCAEHVERCWRSIVRQQPGHYTLEVVLVDDGSSDGTRDALELATRALPLPARHALRIVRHEENRGPAFSRWEAILAVKDSQAVLAFLDMDDELFESALASVARAYLSDEKCWLTIGNWQNQFGRPNPLEFYTEGVVTQNAYRRTKEFRLGHLRSFRRFLADALSGDEFRGPDGSWLMYCTDVALLFPLIEQCGAENIRYLREPLYLYNERREGGTLARFGKDKKRELYRWIRAQPTQSHRR